MSEAQEHLFGLTAEMRDYKICVVCHQPQPRTRFHRTPRPTADGLVYHCMDCDKERKRRYRAGWTPEQRQKEAQTRRAWKDANPDKMTIFHKRYHLKAKYGLTVEQYDEMAEAQNWCCGICGRRCDNWTELHVDHCHQTGRVRGLLCRACNVGIGFLGDTEEAVQRAVDYLRGAP